MDDAVDEVFPDRLHKHLELSLDIHNLEYNKIPLETMLDLTILEYYVDEFVHLLMS